MSVIVAKGVAQCCTAVVGCGPVVPVSSRLVLIYPGQTEIVDALDVSDFLGTKWLVDLTAITTSNQRSLAFEVYAAHRYGVNPAYVGYGFVGQPMSHSHDVSVVGSDMQLTVTNTSASDVYLAAVTRVPIITSGYSLQIISGAINPLSVPFTNISATVPALSAGTVVDSLPFTKYLASKWILKVTDTVTTEARSIEVYGNQIYTGTAHYDVYSGLGQLPLVVISTQMTGNDFELIVDNGRANPVEVRAIREPVVLDPSVLCCVCNCGSIDVIPINDVVVPASSTLTVDTVAVAAAASVKWLFALRNPTTSEAGVFQVHATTEDGVNAKYNVYGMVGDVVLSTIDVTISAGAFVLDISNLETDDIVFDAARIVVVP